DHPGKTVRGLAWPTCLQTCLKQIMAELSRSPRARHLPLPIDAGQVMLEWGAMVIPHCDSRGALACATFIFDDQPACGSASGSDSALAQELQREKEKCDEAVAASR